MEGGFASGTAASRLFGEVLRRAPTPCTGAVSAKHYWEPSSKGLLYGFVHFNRTTLPRFYYPQGNATSFRVQSSRFHSLLGQPSCAKRIKQIYWMHHIEAPMSQKNQQF